jgi:2,3-bisphosphoglycerate-independent phosphoglycerate mutase
LGWTVREVPPGRTDDLGELAVDALGTSDLVCVCDAGALRASLAGDATGKARALERFDAEVVARVKARLTDFGDPEDDAEARGWRLLALPDAIWPTGALEPSTDPVPAILAGAWIRSVVERPFTEAGAEDSDLRISSPSGLMEFFLEGGLVRAKAVRKRKDEVGTLWELDT